MNYYYLMRLSDSLWFSVYMNIFLRCFKILRKMSQKCEQFSYEGFFSILFGCLGILGPKWSPPTPAHPHPWRQCKSSLLGEKYEQFMFLKIFIMAFMKNEKVVLK